MDEKLLKEVEEFYWQLNKIYSSEHSDSVDEVQRAIDILFSAIYRFGVSRDLIVRKLRQMKATLSEQNTRRPKLTVAIYSKFWEKTFVDIMPIRRFRLEA